MDAPWIPTLAILLILIGVFALFKRQIAYPFRWVSFQFFRRKIRAIEKEALLTNDHIDNASRRFNARSHFTALVISERARLYDPFKEDRKLLLKSACQAAIQAGIEYEDLNDDEAGSWESAYGLNDDRGRQGI